MALTKAKTPSQRRRRPHGRPNRRLQALRINEGLTPNALAYRAGVSGNTIRAAEAGFRPMPQIQRAIAQVFEVQCLDIWPLEEWR